MLLTHLNVNFLNNQDVDDELFSKKLDKREELF